MKKNDLKKVLNWLGFMLHCPVCNAKYDFSNIKIIDSDHDEYTADARLLIHSDCQKCKSSVMFNIDINGPDIFTVIAKTDLTSQDSDKFSELEAIDVNDCITVHKTLNAFHGDFIKALKAHGPARK
ncbi:MAG TPA: hypothetical protein VHQ41_01535 [Patescibacteria group bacterium]|jgi:hypothetical protein|nr:hypothetical protein [Patescibacteria group bacterium]